MRLTRRSPCKVNLLLNILGRRVDGYHELETLFLPVGLYDDLEFESGGEGIRLECHEPGVPVDGTNLVVRAASAFFCATGLPARVRIRLTKRIPVAAGLGGGSGNAACTLAGLNELQGHPLPEEGLRELAAGLGSDVPYFLQNGPAQAHGRGERIELTPPLVGLRGMHLLLVHPGFGVPTGWAYGRLGAFPEALEGRPGRVARMVERLAAGDREGGLAECYNTLEAPVFEKHPVLRIYRDFLRREGAVAALMSGSGSTTFGLFAAAGEADAVRDRFLGEFGKGCWTARCGVEV